MNEQCKESGSPYIPSHVLQHVFRHFQGRETFLATHLVNKEWRDVCLHTSDWRSQYRSLWRTPTDGRIREAYDSLQQEGSSVFLGSCADTDSLVWYRMWLSKYKEQQRLRNRPNRYTLYGHRSGVKMVQWIPGCNALLTGGVDRKAILWDAQYFAFRSVSKPFGGAVKCATMDDSILAVGSSDHRIRVWLNQHDGEYDARTRLVRDDWQHFLDVNDERHPDEQSYDTGDRIQYFREKSNWYAGQSVDRRFPFHLEGERMVLVNGHCGPVSSLATTQAALFSGSWDDSVRVWDKRIPENIECVQVVRFDDWVLDMKRTKDCQNLFVASGSQIHHFDMHGGALREVGGIRHPDAERENCCTCLSHSEDGSLLLYASGGQVFPVDLRCRSGEQMEPLDCNRLTKSRGVAVMDISFEYPWVASSMGNGKIALINIEEVARCKSRGDPGVVSQFLSAGKPMIAHCVDICEGKVAAGYEDGTVMGWNFL